MTPKEALNNIWRDAYPKARDKWSADRFREHWYIVQKALGELEELKKDLARYFELTRSDCIKQRDWPEYLVLKDKLSKRQVRNNEQKTSQSRN